VSASGVSSLAGHAFLLDVLFKNVFFGWADVVAVNVLICP